MSTATRELIDPACHPGAACPGQRQDYFRADLGAGALPQFIRMRIALTHRWTQLMEPRRGARRAQGPRGSAAARGDPERSTSSSRSSRHRSSTVGSNSRTSAVGASSLTHSLGSTMLDGMSTIEDRSTDVNEPVARRVRELAAARHLSLDALAERCGVSRSISPSSSRRGGEPHGRGARQARRPARRFPGVVVRRNRSPTQSRWRAEPISHCGLIRSPGSRGATSRLPAFRRPIQIVEVLSRRAPAVAYRSAGRHAGCTSRCGCSRKQ